VEAGAQAITHPACPRCHRLMHLHRRINGQWLCRNCVAKSRAQPCSRCGTVREIAARDERNYPLCPHCLITDPANREVCVGCDRRRPVVVRTADGPWCSACRPMTTMPCSICGRSAPCWISKTTGAPWCLACQQRWDRCTGCGEVQPVRGGSRTEPLCARCTRPDPSFWRTCPSCGQTAQLRSGPCARCRVEQRVRELLGDEHGQTRPELEPLHRSLVSVDHPNTVLAWLGNSTGAAILRQLAAGERPLTHAALDELPDSKPLRHLRSMLVATGALPARDEHMARLERWVDQTISDRDMDAEQQQLLHRYADWHLLRRLRHRTRGSEVTHSQFATVRQHLRSAITLLDWLTAHHLTLATARQGDLETWLTSDDATHRREAGHFVRWARRQRLTSLDFPAVKWGGPTGGIDAETHWQQARWLLHDDTLKPEDRVAGLLVLLYAQWPSTVSRLTLDHVHTDGEQVRLRLGREPVVLPEPLAGLVGDLVATRRGHAALADQGTSRWLFPGGQPGRPVSAYQLGERLRQLGLRPGQARSTALFQLATELPAAVLARLLGIHISVAVAWQRACGGDWTAYAAEVSRRPRHDQQPRPSR
jgi:hypothetical protein